MTGSINSDLVKHCFIYLCILLLLFFVVLCLWTKQLNFCTGLKMPSLSSSCSFDLEFLMLFILSNPV